MSFEDAQYYISETKQFVSYDEFMRNSLDWRLSFDKLTAYDIKASMVEEGE
tara:strand:+ start:159 stop:311 length:153 start_codon:yes stop_codon:yes gene_type:complete